MTDDSVSKEQSNAAEFYPFHTINEFMRNDYRMTVVRSTLGALNSLPAEYREPIDKLIKKLVKVPGFRHPEKAPVAVKALPMAKAFEKNPEVVSAILAAWAESHADLRAKVYDLLQARGWKMFPTEFSLEMLSPDVIKEWGVLPLSVDRTRLPGFVSLWPEGNEFEAIYQHFNELHSNIDESLDNVSLMVVWVSLRLPIDVEGG